ncbi:uncharacterized protein VNE69_09139 [Vairimorpha necatrix]|uniref:Uncharacterized protein n=1 Tax=Vairimorpha necatrix TaxID=6039 RepID=A0AAX4JF49_9MICR
MNFFLLYLLNGTCINTVSLFVFSERMNETNIYLGMDEDLSETASCFFEIQEYAILKDKEVVKIYNLNPCDESDLKNIYTEYNKHEGQSTYENSNKRIFDVKRILKTSFDIQTNNIYRIFKKSKLNNTVMCSEYFLFNFEKKFYTLELSERSKITKDLDVIVFDNLKDILFFDNQLNEMKIENQQDKKTIMEQVHNPKILPETSPNIKQPHEIYKEQNFHMKKNNDKTQKYITNPKQETIDGQVYDSFQHNEQRIKNEEHSKSLKNAHQNSNKIKKNEKIYKAPKKSEQTYKSPKNIEQTYKSPQNIEQTYKSPKNIEQTYKKPKNIEQTYKKPKNIEETYKRPPSKVRRYFPSNSSEPATNEIVENSNGENNTNSEPIYDEIDENNNERTDKIKIDPIYCEIDDKNNNNSKYESISKSHSGKNISVENKDRHINDKNYSSKVKKISLLCCCIKNNKISDDDEKKKM